MPLWHHSVHHDGSPQYVQTDGQLGSSAIIRLRVDHAAPVEAVFIRTCPDGEQQITPLHAEPTQAGAVCRWWRAEVPVQMLRTGYRFLLSTSMGNFWYNGLGLSRSYPTDANDFKLLAAFAAPAWVRDAVFYQIFPDRFADGDPTNNVQTGSYHYGGKPVVARQWGELPNRAAGPREFYGGDLQGVAQKLAYLTDLGVSAIYLNPIFTAPSNHKYDVASYTQIDPHLGGESALQALRQALDDHAMQLMLDIVPNHCGATHPWFLAAQADATAPEAEFFTFREHPHSYESWLGVASLPKLNYVSEHLRELMYAGDDAVMRFWLRPPYRIDAWRIDVANMLGRQGPANLGHKIGRGIRRAVKAERADAYILGEHFFDGSPHLQGDELDATMNYQGFTFPVWRWLAGPISGRGPIWDDPQGLSTSDMVAQWASFRAAIPWQIATQQFNLLGSHDTPRLHFSLGGNRDLVRVAFALLFTYPGVPCIYYGDEIGLDGGPDPDCRRTMPWDSADWDTDLRSFVRQLAHLRRSAPALRWGGFQLLQTSEHSVAFLREAPEERLIIVARRAADTLQELPVRHGGIADGSVFRDLLSGASATVQGEHLPLSANALQIWQQVD